MKTTIYRRWLTGFLLLVFASSSAIAQNEFITTWQTTTANENIAIGVQTPTYTYDYTIDWGDGTVETNQSGEGNHTYTNAGSYQVKISGTYPQIFLCGSTSAPKLMSIDQWGDNVWQDFTNAFEGATNMVYNATDIPDVSNVLSISKAFSVAEAFNGDLSGWDVSKVITMQAAFEDTKSFNNSSLANWDVSSVLDARRIFRGSAFNGDISSWNTSSFASMDNMFSNSVFNGDITSWNVSSVESMIGLFNNNGAFNQSIGGWDVSNVTDFGSMFHTATAFNQDINDWDIKGANVASIFQSATAFNQDISDWDLSETTSLRSIFFGASSFNQDISGWDLSKTTSMNSMFEGALAFNQDLSSWDVSAVTDMNDMFSQAQSFNQPMGSWDISQVTDMDGMLNNTLLSLENYDNTLAGWAGQTVQSGVNLGALGLSYCDGALARESLVADDGWSITDNGERCGTVKPLSGVKDSDTQIIITYNMNVRTNGQNPTSFVVKDALGTEFEVTAQRDGTQGDDKIVLTVADLSVAVGDLFISYFNNFGEIKDFDTGLVEQLTSLSPLLIDVDMVAPVLVEAEADSDTKITLTLSEIVQTNESNPGDFTVTDTNGTNFPVLAQADAQSNDNKIVLTVASLTAAVGDLEVTYTNNNTEISDFGDNDMATDATGVIIADFDISNLNPTANAVAVSRAGNIDVTFSEDVNRNTLSTENVFFSGNQGSRPAIGTPTVSGTTAGFDPGRNFFPGEKVSVSLTSNVQSTGGSSLPASFVYQFIAGTEPSEGFFPDAATDLPTDNEAGSGVAFGDVDNDGDLDAIILNHNQANRLLINDGAGNFSLSTSSFPADAEASQAISFGDVDGDGDLDAFILNSGVTSRLLINDGSGNFSNTTGTLPGFADTRSGMDMGDVDGDGDLDIIVASQSQANRLLVNDGAGNYSLTTGTFPAESEASADIALGDVDGDGDLDAIVVNQNLMNRLLINDGAGNFSNSTRAFPATAEDSRGVALGDVDGDGDLDAVVINSSKRNNLLINDGLGNFSNTTGTFPVDFDRNNDLALGDIDGDGDLDIVAAVEYSSPKLVLNDGAGNFNNAPSDRVVYIGSLFTLALGDVDGDGDLDALMPTLNRGDRLFLNRTPIPTMVSAVQTSNTEITVTYDLKVYSNGGNPLDFTVTDALGNNFLVNAQAHGTLVNADIILAVADLSSAIGDLTVTYTNNNNEIRVIGLSSSAETDATGVVIDADEVAPTLLSGVWNSTTQLTIRFSELIQTNEGNSGDFSVVDAMGASFDVIAQSDDTPNDNSIVLTVADFSGATGPLTVTYTNNNNEISDFGSNPLDTDGTGIVIALVPQLLSATVNNNTQITVAFNENVQTIGGNASDFSVKDALGNTFSVVGEADGTAGDMEIILTVKDFSTAIGDLTVTYTNNGSNEIVDAATGTKFAGTSSAKAKLDASPPVLLSGIKDNDNQLTITFNELVRTRGGNPTDFTITDAIGTDFQVLGQIDGTRNDANITLITGDLRSAVGNLKVVYTNNNNQITDLEGNSLMTDLIGISVVTYTNELGLWYLAKDSDTQISLNFLRPVMTNEGNPTDFTIVDAVGNSFEVIAQLDDIPNDNIIVLTVADFSSAVGSLFLSYTNNNNEISDFAGNTFVLEDIWSLDLDQTDPEMLSATKDSDSQVTVTFDELVEVITSYGGSAGFLLQDGAGNRFNILSVADGNAQDQEIILTVSNLASAIGDLRLSLPSQNNSQIYDFGGNNIAQNADGILIDTDVSAPLLASAHRNSDTEITVIFSEPIQTNAGNPTDFTLVDGNDTDYQVSAQVDGTILDDRIILTVADISGATGALTLTYTNNNDEVSDLGGNTLESDNTGVNVLVSPVMLSAEKDSDTQITLTYNQDIQTNEGNPSDFTLVDAAGVSYAVSSQVDDIPGDNKIVLTVADLSTVSGGIDITYTNNNNEISDNGGTNFAATDAMGITLERPLIITWDVTSISSVLMLLDINGKSDFVIDWGDGNIEAIRESKAAISHGYSTPAVYTIKISGIFPGFAPENYGRYSSFQTSWAQLKTVEQWGSIKWQKLAYAFNQASGMTVTATDAPDLSGVTSLQSMFFYAESMNGDIEHWDVSNITDMSRMFQGANTFNQPLDDWDMSNVTSLELMFGSAGSFNQPLDQWDVSNVTDFSDMFSRTGAFNQPIGDWNTSSMTQIEGMFEGAMSFNQPIDNWDVSGVAIFDELFEDTDAFNQDLNNWNTSNATSMEDVFQGAEAFNGDISGWDVGNVTDMSEMFEEALVFNRDLGSWDLSSATTIEDMFQDALAFNQDLSNWDVSNVQDFDELFKGATAFNGNITTWNTSSATDLADMFRDAQAFNQDLSGWNVTSSRSFSRMFNNSGLSYDNYDKILNSWSDQNVQSDREFGAVGIKYSTIGKAGRQKLIDDYGWKIEGDEIIVSLIGGVQKENDKIELEFSEAIELSGLSNTDFGVTDENGKEFIVTGIDDGTANDEFLTLNSDLSGAQGKFVVTYTNTNDAITDAETGIEISQNTEVIISRAFLTTWNIAADGDNLILPLNDQLNSQYGFTIDWGDGITETVLGRSKSFLSVGGKTTFTKTDNADISLEANQDRITADVWITRGTDKPLFNYNEQTSYSNSSATVEWALGATQNLQPGDYTSDFQAAFGGGVGNKIVGATVSLHLIEEDLYYDLVFTSWTRNGNGGGFGYTRSLVEEKSDISHAYSIAGDYRVSVSGSFPSIDLSNSPHKGQLTSLDQWGSILWQQLNGAFKGASNMVYSAFDIPILSNTTSLVDAFSGATSFDGNLAAWDMSELYDLRGMLDNTGLSVANYDATLIGWAAQALNNNIRIGAIDLEFCTDGETARQYIIDTYGWSFSGDTKNAICEPLVTEVAAPENGIYGIGDVLSFTVIFDQAISITGTPFIPVIIGNSTVNAIWNGVVSAAAEAEFVYTVVEGDSDIDGIAVGMAIDLNGGSIQNAEMKNAALTLNNVAATSGVLVDGVKPIPTITSSAVSLVNGPFSITLTFDEAVENFEVNDLTVGNGVASNFAGSGDGYTATITPSSDGTVTVDIAADLAQDVAGNDNTAATQFSIENDETAPGVTITSAANDPINGAFDITVTFSENVIGLALADLTVGNGVASNFAGSGAVYTTTITPSADGAVTVDIASAIAQDAAGNDNTAATQFSIENDETAPTVTITTIASDPASGAFDITITFSEDVTGFDVADLVLGNGVASNLVGAGSAYTATITPVADGTVTVDVAAAVAQDAAGNNNTAAIQFSIENDETRPAVTITSLANDPINGTFDITLTFSEDVTGLDVNDIAVGNGTAAGFTGSGAVYTATITPTTDGTVTVDVAAAVAQDAAGNDNTAAVQFSIQADITAPVVPVITAISDDTGSDNADRITSDNTIVFSGVAEANSTVEVFINGSSIGSTTADGSGKWTFDHSGSSLADASYSVTATAMDVAGNTSVKSTALSFTVDTVAPAKPVLTAISDDNGISSTDIITNDGTLIYFGTAEPLSSVTLKSGPFTLLTTTVDANGDWVGDFTNRPFTSPLTVLIVATDVAGNVSVDSDANFINIDVDAPQVVSINRADPNPTVATSVNFTATFSEETHGLSTSSFALALTGTQNANIASLSASSGTSITITVDNISGEGSFGLNLSDITGITDVAGNDVAGTFTGEVYNTNFAPTDISLSASSILENNAIGDLVAMLSTTDPDAGDTHTYSLVAGTGDADNAPFTIIGDELKAAEVFDLETKASYDIRLMTDDGRGGTFEKALTISIDNVPEADLRISGDGNVPATPLGISANFDITIHNDGDARLTVGSILYPTAFGGPVSGIIIAPASSQVVPMNFTPIVAQLYTGDITIITNGGTGTLSVSGDGAIITSVDDGPLKAASINLYPNPVSDIVTIDISKYNGRALDIQLYDMSGIKTFGISEYKEPTLKLDVSGYQNGLYLMQFTDGESTVQKKVMIRK